MKVSRFDVWLADLNPRMGTEPGKVRPVLVVQTNLLNEIHPSTVICPITSNTTDEATLIRVRIGKESGLQTPSDVMIDQIRAVDNRRLLKRMGRISQSARQKVANGLIILMDL